LYKSLVGKLVGCRISHTFYNKYETNYQFGVLKERHILHLQVQYAESCAKEMNAIEKTTRHNAALQYLAKSDLPQ
jgi:hypothetical protein